MPASKSILLCFVASNSFLHLLHYNLHIKCCNLLASHLQQSLFPLWQYALLFLEAYCRCLQSQKGKMDATPMTLNSCQLDLNWDSFSFSLGTPAIPPCCVGCLEYDSGENLLRLLCPIQMVATTATRTIYHVYLLSTGS